MSEETATTEAEEAATTEAEDAAKARPGASKNNPLFKEKDAAARPGFRNPSNKGSKAQRKKKKR